MRLTGKHVLNYLPNTFCTPAFVFIGVKFAVNKDCIERAAIAGSENLRINNICTSSSASSSNNGKQSWMIGCKHSDFSHRLKGVRLRHGCKCTARTVSFANEMRMAHLILQCDSKEVISIM